MSILHHAGCVHFKSNLFWRHSRRMISSELQTAPIDCWAPRCMILRQHSDICCGTSLHQGVIMHAKLSFRRVQESSSDPFCAPTVLCMGTQGKNHRLAFSSDMYTDPWDSAPLQNPDSVPKPPISMVSHKGSETRSSRGPLESMLPDPDQHPFEFPYNCRCVLVLNLVPALIGASFWSSVLGSSITSQVHLISCLSTNPREQAARLRHAPLRFLVRSESLVLIQWNLFLSLCFYLWLSFCPHSLLLLVCMCPLLDLRMHSISLQRMHSLISACVVFLMCSCIRRAIITFTPSSVPAIYSRPVRASE